MDQAAYTFAPPLPLPFLAAGVGIAILLLVIALRRAASIQAKFLILAIGLRVIFDAAAAFTLRPLPGGLTANALLSVATVGIGLLLVPPRSLRAVLLVPFYLMIGLIGLSALMNGFDMAAIQVIVKYAYFIAIFILAASAFAKEGANRTVALIGLSLAPAVIFQLLSLVAGTANASPTDGSVAFIGGFNHESIFSLVVATHLLLVCFSDRQSPLMRLGVILLLLVSLYLANYRTVILGLLPLLGVFGIQFLAVLLPPRQRALPLIAVAVIAAVGIAGVASDPEGRFGDAMEMVRNPGELIRPPDSFTPEERRFASARALVWSQYWYGFAEARGVQQIIGHGPDSWQSRFRVYAQNTFLSYLFEFGITGALAITFAMTGMALSSLRAPPVQRYRLVAAHFGFLLINLSTMPFWIVEGLIFYGLLCGLTVHYGWKGAPALTRPQAALQGRLAANPKPAISGT
ncbi:O-antigen ligase family protein [Pacificimonas flava]|uniref:O-antigen ligase-related domain-containing protein n=1 Tax=Pacificimonas flava TaxID=1234595 RepID=M2TRB7_9SPHN|nr:O-antigen ligase family protein [Pacificimonas flava]EMD84326.1 hypothetical protein C725_0256 [Pacificimonas flava]MBB5279799.1 hypothetical protein [Pacificimonas flava]